MLEPFLTQLMTPCFSLALPLAVWWVLGRREAIDREIVDRSKNKYVLIIVLLQGKLSYASLRVIQSQGATWPQLPGPHLGPCHIPDKVPALGWELHREKMFATGQAAVCPASHFDLVCPASDLIPFVTWGRLWTQSFLQLLSTPILVAHSWWPGPNMRP